MFPTLLYEIASNSEKSRRFQDVKNDVLAPAAASKSPNPLPFATQLDSKQRARLRNMSMGGGAVSAQEDRARQASGSPTKSAKRLNLPPA